jgi:hypothetical protein
MNIKTPERLECAIRAPQRFIVPQVDDRLVSKTILPLEGLNLFLAEHKFFISEGIVNLTDISKPFFSKALIPIF